MRGRPVVLLVEDDGDLRDFFRLILCSAGYEVHAAADGYQALAAIENGVPDLVVLDLILPRVRGMDVIDELADHPQTRKIPVVVITGSMLTADRRNVSCVLRKPVEGHDLLVTVRQQIGSPAESCA